MRIVKEMYYALFVLFFRLGAGQWPAYVNADAHKGVAGVSMVEVFLLVSAFNWLEISIGQALQLNHWFLWVAALIVYATNYFFLVSRGGGITFEKRFANLEEPKRLALRASAITIVLMSAVIFYFSMVKFQSAFHIRMRN